MWGRLQTHGDKKNDAEVLAIAAAGAPLDVIAMFFESHIEEFDKPLNRSDQPQPTIKLTEVQDNTKPACDG